LQEGREGRKKEAEERERKRKSRGEQTREEARGERMEHAWIIFVVRIGPAKLSIIVYACKLTYK